MTLVLYKNKLLRIWRNKAEVIKELDEKELELVKRAEKLGILDIVLNRLELVSKGLEKLEDIEEEVAREERLYYLKKKIVGIAERLGWKEEPGSLDFLEYLKKNWDYLELQDLIKWKSKNALVEKVLEEIKKLEDTLRQELENEKVEIKGLEKNDWYEEEDKIYLIFVTGNSIITVSTLNSFRAGKLVAYIYLVINIMEEYICRALVLSKKLEIPLSL